MDIDADTCLKEWNDLVQDYKELEVRIVVIVEAYSDFI